MVIFFFYKSCSAVPPAPAKLKPFSDSSPLYFSSTDDEEDGDGDGALSEQQPK